MPIPTSPDTATPTPTSNSPSASHAPTTAGAIDNSAESLLHSESPRPLTVAVAVNGEHKSITSVSNGVGAPPHSRIGTRADVMTDKSLTAALLSPSTATPSPLPSSVSYQPPPLTAAASSAVEAPLPQPQLHANIISTIFLIWMSPLLQLGASRPLQQSDLYDTYPAEETGYVYDKFAPVWADVVQKAREANKKPSLLWAFTRLYGWDFLFAAAVYAYTNADLLLGPYFLQQLVIYSEQQYYFPGSQSQMDGYKWAIALFASAVGAGLMRSYSLQLTLRIMLRVRNILVAVIFRKALTISPKHRNDGQIQNLMASDSQKLIDLAQNIHNVWSGPIILAAGIYELYQQVAWSSLLGFGVMLLSLPIVGVLTARQIGYQKMASNQGDVRIQMVNEFIQGIRVVKYYAWEKPFLGALSDAREKELQFLTKYAYWRSGTFGILMLVPLLVSVLVFVTYATTGGVMSAQVVFTSVALLAVIRFPFFMLPLSIAGLTTTLVSFDRIQKYLTLPDMDATQVQPLPHVGIVLENAEFTWPIHTEAKDEKKKDEKKDEKKETPATPQGDALTKSEHTSTQFDLKPDAPSADDAEEKEIPRLTGLNLSLRAGSLCTIFGSVGSGKSTLIYGLLGEVPQTGGVTRIGGNIAYVPQTAFIINASLRDNILFGHKYNEARYNAVIAACALKPDLDLLPNRDLTEIGERGINISGGQKQRISLARAAYNENADIILLDDPLSAVDMHVAVHIFTHCINGIMKGKLRVLVTHSLQFVAQSDDIILLKPSAHCKDTYVIGAHGSSEQLLQTDADYQSLYETYYKGKEDLAGTGHTDTSTATIASPNKTVAASASKSKAIIDESAVAAAKEKGKLLEEEERETGQIDFSVWKFYVSNGVTVFFGIFIPASLIAFQAFQTLSDFWLASWSNAIGDGTDTSKPEAEWLGVYGGLLFLSTCGVIGRTTSISLFGVNAARNMHKLLAQRVLAKSISWFDRTPAGRIINRFTKDMYIVDQMLSIMNEWMLATTLGTIGIICVIAAIVPISLAAFAVLAVIYVIWTNYYRLTNRELQRLESISRTPIFVHFGETLNGSITIRALRLQSMYSKENVRRCNENSRALYFARTVSFWIRVRLDMIGAFILATAACLGCAQGSINTNISPGNFGLLISYALQITQQLNFSALLISQVEAMMNSVERIKHYSQPNDEEKWNAEEPALIEEILSRGSPSHPARWPDRGHVVFDNVQMRYRANLDLVLKSVCLDIPPASRVGIVGRTGSGKSSLLVALFRMVELSGGTISIDDVDISKISLTDLRSNISIIPQDANMFAGTLRYNLDPFAKFTDDAIWTALSYVQLKDVIERMPNQLSTLVAEAGTNLSGGQRQLICMARALLRQPKLICLDEATANVDIETDKLIQKVVREQFALSTVIIIAHRLNTVLDADLIVVMDRGVVAECDTPANLRSKPNSIFASMLTGKSNEKQEDGEAAA